MKGFFSAVQLVRKEMIAAGKMMDWSMRRVVVVHGGADD